ncbi:MAG TPA: hypothetical protein EYM96_11935 [Rhodospirillales bacterium]|nr:hypothetical protein [Rhodospirillales bacterium]
MTAEVSIEDEDGNEIVEDMPVKYEVCDTCNGSGSHVNPSIDCNGLTSDDFHDDPDFAEEYFAGRHDVTCYGCGGKRVVPIVAAELLNPRQKEVLEQIELNAQYEAEYQAEVAMERRYGC